MEWGYDDAPDRQLVFPGDFPERDEVLPKFLDDPTAAKFMAGLATDPNKRRRLIVELLARTGMRASELGALESDAMVTVGDTHWLRIPVGKLHDDRYVLLHPIGALEGSCQQLIGRGDRPLKPLSPPLARPKGRGRSQVWSRRRALSAHQSRSSPRSRMYARAVAACSHSPPLDPQKIQSCFAARL
jgi:integrase/recombinase XerD